MAKRYKRQPLPANAKYLYEVYVPAGKDWRHREIVGRTDDEEFARTWIQKGGLNYSRVTGVLIHGDWYILASVYPARITSSGRPSMESFDPAI